MSVEPLPPIVAQPVALPLAAMPVGAWPVAQSDGVVPKAVVVAALPVVFAALLGMSVDTSVGSCACGSFRC